MYAGGDELLPQGTEGKNECRRGAYNLPPNVDLQPTDMVR